MPKLLVWFVALVVWLVAAAPVGADTTPLTILDPNLQVTTFVSGLNQPIGIIFIEPNDRFFVTPSRQLQEAADNQFGEETYYVKVDTTLPERQQRWARKTEYGNGEE